jgi:hypothetical protein
MRTIKFRAWDGARMKEVINIGWIDGVTDYISTPKTSAPADNFVLMQYTGLHDKNGKEIFEGDILHRKDQYAVVSWNKHVSGFCGGDSPTPVRFYIINPAPYVVIGNIYENPELVEKLNIISGDKV